MSGTFNPLISQGGPLNRLRCSVVLGSFTNLNVTSSYMSKSFAKVTFNSAFVTQIGTGTGIIQSPEPYVMTSISFGLLRTQPLASAWYNQLYGSTGVLGNATIIPDTSAFPSIQIFNAAISGFDPSAFDGADATISVTLSGVSYPNVAMWSFQ